MGDVALSTGIPRPLMDKTISILLAIVVLLVLAWASIVWLKSNNAEMKNVEQDGQIKAISTLLDVIDKRQTRMEEKQDRLNDKLDRVLEWVRK